MTTALRKARPAGTKVHPAHSIWRCGYCANGLHKSCPRVVWHGKVLWQCRCEDGGDDHHGLYCTECKHDRADEVNEETWTCLDPHACATRARLRREEQPIYRMVLASKVHAAVRRKIKARMEQGMAVAIDPREDESIDRLHDLLDSLEDLKRTNAKPRTRSKPRPSVGKCECCGEPTRGGRFLPGHDARLASALVARIRNSRDREAYEEMERRGWLSKVPAALRSEMSAS